MSFLQRNNCVFFSFNRWLNQKVLILLASLPSTVYSIPALAQLVPDATLGGQPSIVHTTNSIDTIQGGRRVGNNLFHSFQEFNVGAGRSLYFTDPGVANILTRVTGNHPSHIQGRLGVNGAANLFLMNPNGIIFGAGASLDMRGAFTATTATAIQFSDGSEFSATNPQAPPLLRVNVPLGIQLGTPRGNLQQSGHLAVADGQTMTLHGQQVTVDGRLTAPGGSVQILGDRISLLAPASVNVSHATGGGTILIGGELQGKGTLPTAQATAIAAGVSLRADGLEIGSAGGTAIVWADQTTHFAGHISAQGGQGGTGGFVEVSGKEQLNFQGQINVLASKGLPGTVLLDPKNITIAPPGTNPIPPNDAFNENPVANVTFSAGAVGALTGNVILQANNDITVNQAINTTSIASLTLQAGRSILLNETIDLGDNASLNLTANSPAASGVIDTQRDPGIATIAMAPGTRLIARQGINIMLDTGAGLTNNAAGNITLATLDTETFAPAASIAVTNRATTGHITLDQARAFRGVELTANGNVTANSISGYFAPVTINAGGDVAIATNTTNILGGMTLQAGGNITVSNGFSLNNIQFNAGNSITANSITADNGDIRFTAGQNIIANDINITTLGNVKMQAANTLQTDQINVLEGEIALSANNALTATKLFSRFGIDLTSQADLTIRDVQVGNNRGITATAGGTINADNVRFVGVGSGGVAILDAGTDINARNILTTAGLLSLNAGRNITANRLGTRSNDSVNDLILKAGGTINANNLSTVAESGVSINSGNLRLEAVGAIAARELVTAAEVSSGNISVLSRTGNIDTQNGLVITQARYRSGNITLTAPKGNITTGGLVSNAQYQAGQITITAAGDYAASNSLISTDASSLGQSGEIWIGARSVSLLKGTQLTTSVRGGAIGGNVMITAPEFVLIEGSTPNGQAPNGMFTAPGNVLNLPTGQQLGGFIPTADFVSEFRNVAIPTGIYTVTSGTGPAGSVSIQTGQLVVKDNNAIAASTLSQGNAGHIAITATDSINLNNGMIASSVAPNVSGNGGLIQLTTGALALSNRSQIQTNTLGQGQAGAVSVQANIINITGDFSGLISGSGTPDMRGGDRGDGGNIRIATGTLQVKDDGIISASTFTQGQGGMIDVNARSVELTNGGKLSATTQNQGDAGSIQVNARDRILISDTGSGIFASTTSQSTGNGGDISLVSSQLVLQDRGRISTGSDGSGPSGNIRITTQEIDVSSQARMTAETTHQGHGGNIDLTTNELTVQTGGRASVSTQGSGNAGNLVVTARDRLLISGNESSLFASTGFQSAGNGGSISVTTADLTILDDGKISAASQGTGRGGDVQVAANQVNLSDRSTIFAETASSDGGNINLNVRDLILMRRNSLISASAGTAQAGGNGGNINITANFVIGVLGEDSDIRANAFTGNGGRVNITAQGIYGLQFQPQDTPFSDITASSQFGLSGTVTLNTLNVDPNRGLVPLPSNFAETNQVAQTCSPQQQQNSFTVTGRGGVSLNPSETLNQNQLWQDKTAPQGRGDGQARSDQPHATLPNPTAIAEATTWQRHPDGSIALVVEGANAAVPLRSIACQSQVQREIP